MEDVVVRAQDVGDVDVRAEDVGDVGVRAQDEAGADESSNTCGKLCV